MFLFVFYVFPSSADVNLAVSQRLPAASQLTVYCRGIAISSAVGNLCALDGVGLRLIIVNEIFFISMCFIVYQ